jgi:hypothetical protein
MASTNPELIHGSNSIPSNWRCRRVQASMLAQAARHSAGTASHQVVGIGQGQSSATPTANATATGTNGW